MPQSGGVGVETEGFRVWGLRSPEQFEEAWMHKEVRASALGLFYWWGMVAQCWRSIICCLKA